MKTIEAAITGHKVVSNKEWLEARKKLLKKEKEATRLRDQLSAERRKLPWVKVEKQYAFDGPVGKQTLADLFGGRSQLVIYHFMFGPDWQEGWGCPSCSFTSDHIDGAIPHLAARDVTMVMVSRAPLAKIEAFKKRMGCSVFYKDPGGNVFHTYSTYGRGVEPLVGTYMILDMVPKGRDEDRLGFSMEWVRHHDRYGSDEFADASKPHWPATASDNN